jgi:hypothetical protein
LLTEISRATLPATMASFKIVLLLSVLAFACAYKVSSIFSLIVLFSNIDGIFPTLDSLEPPPPLSPPPSPPSLLMKEMKES